MRVATFRRGVPGLLALALLLTAAGAASAQIPDEFTNLTVLPKDISRDQLVSVMRNFAGALGVRCNFCHVGESPDSLEGYDFASDEPEHKRVARGMMRMVDSINGKLLPAAGLKSPMRVRCVTCHRGLEEPEMLDELLLEVIEDDGVDAAVKRYRELREEYYGSGSYDFGPGTLNSVAEKLAGEKQDVDSALALTQLNVEFNPDATYSYLMLGQLYMAQGNKEKAVASVERALELEPDNGHAKRLLQRLQAAD